MENTIQMPAKIREAFLRVLADCVPAYGYKRLGGIIEEDQPIIQRRVDRLLYVPCLPCAGDAERQMVRRFEELAAQKDWDGHPRAFAMAHAFTAILPADPRNPGCYYTRRPLTPKSNKQEYEWVKATLDAARTAKEWERAWFAEQVLLGFPKSVSNFRMECLFLLCNSEGLVTRLVRLKNNEGEVSRGPHPGGCEILDARAFCSSERFSEWALSHGNNVWDGGVTELRMLQTDISKETAWRVVNQVDSCGWYPLKGQRENGLLPGIYFFNDCAYANGILLRPDEHGIYWYGREGYYLSRKGRESHFLQGRPAMQPDKSATQLLNFSDWKNAPEDQTEIGVLRAFFREICQRVTETLGGSQGLLALGSMFAYAAAPEIFAQYGSFPGLFVHGQKGSGKTKLISWLMAVWGFLVQSGISLTERASTVVGMLQELENYSNLPVWFDEYRDHQIDQGKVAVLRNSFDRARQAKYSEDGKQRETRTAPVVAGESTSSDAATRSRFPHIQVSAHQRKENHLVWFTANRHSFFLLARSLMERRAEFVDLHDKFLDFWMKQEALAEVDEREKMVHGIPYASWMAMTGLLQSHSNAEVTAFKDFMLAYSRSAACDVASETNINALFSDLIIATVNGAIPLSCYRLEATIVDHPPGANNVGPDGNFIQGRWTSYILYIDAKTALAHLQIFLRKQGASVVLKRKDIRDQLSVEPYWVAGNYTKHFRGSTTIRPWGIKVDLHPMGTRTVSDAESNQFKANPNQGDPRKGELFGIIDKILEAEQAAERAKT